MKFKCSFCSIPNLLINNGKGKVVYFATEPDKSTTIQIRDVKSDWAYVTIHGASIILRQDDMEIVGVTHEATGPKETTIHAVSMLFTNC